MSSRFHPQLINDPFGDPGLYVEFMFEKRAVLFDLGDLVRLTPRKLLRVSDVFISHMHMDHFCGFDTLLRLMLGRQATLRLYGPEGLVDAIAHKLAAYTWNLVDRYHFDLTLVVAELGGNQRLRTVEFHCRQGFRRQGERVETSDTGVLRCEDSFCVKAAILDHGIPCLAFALEERAHVNIWKNRIEQLGLRVGPWLRDLKQAVLRRDPDDTTIEAAWKEDGRVVKRAVLLGELSGHAAIVTPGVKLAYVVDAAPTDANFERIARLAEGATILFIEAAFLHEDETRARERQHLTAKQAGELARRAGVQRLVPLHHSPRYEGRGDELVREAEAAFRAAGNSGN
jgi:ribonuclease Z